MGTSFTPSPIFEPQWIAALPAPLIFKPTGAKTVPNGFTYQINSCNVANASGAPVILTIWRVPAGSGPDDQHLRVVSVQIPAATGATPWYNLGILIGINLLTGDAIYAAAGTANALVIDADGLVIQ